MQDFVPKSIITIIQKKKKEKKKKKYKNSILRLLYTPGD